MKRYLLFLFICSFFHATFSQTKGEEEDVDILVVDSLYREDQFYFGFTFNLLNQLPEQVSQSGFSGGLQLGFIRDMPINDRRNLAIGIGLGWSINTYAHNLFIGETSKEETIFQVLDSDELDYKTNRFVTYLLEAPIEFRWRSSSATTYNFWRVYAGLKPGYIYYFRSKFEQPGNQVSQTKLDELNRFRLGATLAVGYNKVNFYFYYSLNPFFSDAELAGEEIGIKTFKIGLIFYIL